MSVILLKQIIKKNSLTTSELAESCNISASYLSLILNGRRTNIDEGILENLAIHLKVSIQEVKNLLAPQGLSGTTDNNADHEQGLLLLIEVLNALERNDSVKINYCSSQLFNICISFPLAERYTEWYRGWHLTLENKFQDALVMFELAKQFQAKTSIEKRFKAKIFSSIGGALVAKGNYKEAMKAFRSSLFLWSSGKQVALVYLNMGTLYRRCHQYNRSCQMYEEAITFGSNFVKIRALSSLAQVAFDKNDLQRARQYVLKGYCIAKTELDIRGKDDLYCNIGTYFSLMGKTIRAKVWLKKSLQIPDEFQNKRTIQYATAELINIFLIEGNYVYADILLANALKEISDNNNDVLALATCFCTIAKRYLSMKEYHSSYEVLVRCYNMLAHLPPSHEQIVCCTLLRNYHQNNRAPYLVDFYKSEIKRIKLKIQ